MKAKEIDLDFNISNLGPAQVRSPINLSFENGDYISNYTDDNRYMLYDIDTSADEPPRPFDRKRVLEKAGPRNMIYFDPAKVNAAVVTCGGLCPGLNNVIRAIVMCLWYRYGVRRIRGIRYGYRGFLPEYSLPVMDLSPEIVSEIHNKGGSILGSSRGHGDAVEQIVDSLERLNINMLFTIGGDGTQKGALAISQQAQKRGLKLSVVGIPKTIDNDLSFVQRSFGFETAVSEAVAAVSAAHVEAHDAPNGVVIVKVMGRDSGFIAAHTALAMNDVNFVLIPEVPFDMEGENGLFANLERRLTKRHHAVILAAEGAGQEHLEGSGAVDASGNAKQADIGVFLQQKIGEYFKSKQMEINLKYIDPSYMIRSAPANANDSLYCIRLGTNAVHAAMVGKTELLISLIHYHFVHVPIRMAVSRKNRINPDGELWRDVTEATGQPVLLRDHRKKPRLKKEKHTQRV